MPNYLVTIINLVNGIKKVIEYLIKNMNQNLLKLKKRKTL